MHISFIAGRLTLSAVLAGCLLSASPSAADRFFLATETSSVMNMGSTDTLETHRLCREGEGYTVVPESEDLGDLDPSSCGVDGAANAYVFAKTFFPEQGFLFRNGSPFPVDSFCDSPDGITVTSSDEVIVACQIPGGGEIYRVPPGAPAELLFDIDLEDLEFDGLSARSASRVYSIVEEGGAFERIYENSQLLAENDAAVALDSIDRISVEGAGTLLVGGEWLGESLEDTNVRIVRVDPETGSATPLHTVSADLGPALQALAAGEQGNTHFIATPPNEDRPVLYTNGTREFDFPFDFDDACLTTLFLPEPSRAVSGSAALAALMAIHGRGRRRRRPARTATRDAPPPVEAPHR